MSSSLIAVLRHRISLRVFCIFLGAIWLLAGIAKLHEPKGGSFLQEFLGARGVLASTILPSTEIVLGAIFIGVNGRPPLAAVVLSSLLLAAFTAHAAHQLLAGQPQASCNCFGAIKTGLDSGWLLLARNSTLLAVSMWVSFAMIATAVSVAKR